MKAADKIYILYEDYGLRIEVIAERLGIKAKSVSSMLSAERRCRGERHKKFSGRYTQKNSGLISYAGAELHDNWQHIKEPSKRVLEGLR